MERLSLTLRLETPADTRAVEILTREAFWNHHGPGCDEHYLAHTLRNAEAFIPALDFIAEHNGVIVGSIMYTRSAVALDTGGTLPVIGFGPLSVLPEYQRQGVGRALIAHTLGLAAGMGFTAVLIYGDPAYYSRAGFLPAEQFGIATEDNQYHGALQAYELTPGALQNARGRFVECSAYHVNPADAEAFDQSFPFKEKVSGTPSQLRFLETVAMCRPRT